MLVERHARVICEIWSTDHKVCTRQRHDLFGVTAGSTCVEAEVEANRVRRIGIPDFDVFFAIKDDVGE